MVRLAQSELYDEIVTIYDDYFVAPIPFEFSTTPQLEMYPLPDDVHKVLGVDLIVTTGQPQSAITLRRFNLAERNRFNSPYYQLTPGLVVPKYRISGSNPQFLWLNPTVNGGQRIRVRYIPKLLPASDSGNIYLTSNPSVGDTFTLNLGFDVINAPPFPLVVVFGPGVGECPIGVDEKATAINLALFLTDAVPTVPLTDGPVSGVTVSFPFTQPVSIIITFPIGQTTVAFDSLTWTNIVNVLAPGWEELIILETAIKAMVKDESDPSALMAQKAAIMRRLDFSAANRDAGSPATTADVTVGYGYGPGYIDGWF